MDEGAFGIVADGTLQRYMETIEATLGEGVDVDLHDGVLTIDVKGGQYLLTAHGPERELGLYSPVSGAARFSYDEERRQWIGTGDGADLAKLLARELGEATGTVPGLD